MIENPHDLHVIRIALLVAIERSEQPGGNLHALPIYREVLKKVERLRDRWKQPTTTRSRRP